MSQSPRRVRILDFIREHFADHGVAPSQTEIARRVGIEKPAVHRHLKRLANEGLIILVAGVARGIRLPERLDNVSDADLLRALSRRRYLITIDGLVINLMRLEPERQ